MKYPHLILLLQAFLAVLPLQAQESPETDSLMSHIRHAMHFNRVVPQEKVYLHLDNMGYFENEQIWFKAYLTRTDTGRPSDLSKVLYVELLNMSGDVIKTTKWPVDSLGQSHGDMKLDSLLGSGYYEVRAYTRYMTNWGANACFSRVVPVFKKPKEEGDYSDLTITTRLFRHRDPNNRDRSDSLYLKAMEEGVNGGELAKTISAQFFPEGGKMIMGKRCRVAVMVVDDNGHPYEAEGHVVSASGDILASVSTDSLGRDVFEITPDGGTMTMQMRNKKKGDGRAVQSFELPRAEQEGCSLSMDVVSDDMLATIQCSDGMKGRTLGCVLMNNGNIIYCDTMSASPLTEIELDRSRQKPGVSQFTVFDTDGRILAERMFFICPPKDTKGHVTVTSKTDRLKPCGKVSLTLSAQPNSTLSFSAIDGETMTNGMQGNMNTWMLLSSDVKGYISNVDYYFEADDTEHRKAADLLMLTQGWRRYDWELMSGQKDFDRPQPVEDKFYVFGKLNAYRKRNPPCNVALEAYLYNESGQSLTGKTKTDSLGHYAFELPFLDGEWKMQIYTRLNEKRKTYYVGIDRQFSPVPQFVSREASRILHPLKPNMFVRSPLAEEPDEEEFIPITKKNHVLQNVTIKAKRRYFTNDNWRYKDESYGRAYATLYYDIDKERDDLLDTGKDTPDIFTFLCMRNSMFEGSDFEGKSTFANDSATIDYTRGISYGGRPIKWIVDNGETACVLVNLMTFSEDEQMKNIKALSQILGSAVDTLSLYADEIPAGCSNRGRMLLDPFFPIWMEEIKHLYIVPNSPKELHGAVRVYLYTHKKFTTESQKGLRRTYFQGFNKPSTFQMEDYSVIPPMADFRRTIYWNPNVRTDKDGKARVEFFNNSTCQEMYISTEGMSDDGEILVGE